MIGLLVSEAGCIRHAKPPALARAAQYLWDQQAGDGGWHSRTYGLLGSGQSLTPFILAALLETPDGIYPPPRTKVDRAVAFIHSNTRSDGAVGMTDPGIPDYPNYATALALSALCRARRPGWEEQGQNMLGYLRAQQFTEENGWGPEHPAYGAWGMGGGRRTPPYTGHVDLSMTRHVLEGLRAAGVPTSDPVCERARVFVERCQNFDTQSGESYGGFFFSTTEFDTNKAGHDGKRYRSYGTTTADGILAMLATGCPADDRRVSAAQRWLTTHHRDMYVPGFSGEAYRRWPRGLAFYYAASSAQAFDALEATVGTSALEALKHAQRADGSWSNAENLVKEDDPLIATGLAVRALAAASKQKLQLEL